MIINPHIDILDWHILEINKAEHAVQSYAAGIGGRGPGGQGAWEPGGDWGLGSIYQQVSDP